MDAFETALHLLRCGRYSEAWPLWRERPSRLSSPFMTTRLREWRGEDLTGKRIVIAGEQGLGDEVMFSRFVPLVRERGAALITLAVRPENVAAMAHLGADAVLDRLSTSSLPPHHYWTQLGSLPELFGVTATNIPPPVPPPVPISTGGGVGFVATGNPDLAHDRYRSLPGGSRLPGATALRPSGDVLQSYRQVAALDLLVTVDTSWAHIAGTLAKPVWLLLPKLAGLDWRWMHDRQDSPWYPSLRLMRQGMDGDWPSLLARVEADLGRVRPNEPHENATRTPGAGADAATSTAAATIGAARGRSARHAVATSPALDADAKI